MSYRICLLLTGYTFLQAVAGAEMSDAEHIQLASQHYSAVEAQLNRAVHYSRTTEKDGEKIIEQAWLSEARDILKVSRDKTGPGGRELTEIFMQDGDAPEFVLTRREQPLPTGGTQVEESRRVYRQFTVIRWMTKQGAFPPGDVLDTVKVKNVTHNVEKLSETEEDGLARSQEALALVKSLIEAGPPDRDPSASPPGDSARYRLIQQTTSPDGRLALALGHTESPADWDAQRDNFDETTGAQLYFDESKAALNFIIDLTTHRILGKTGCQFIGTRHRYNHRENTVSWSPRSGFFVQVFDSKWSTDEAVAGWVDTKQGITRTADVTGPAATHAYALLAARKDAAFHKFGRNFAVRCFVDQLQDDGALTLDVTGEIPKSMDDHSEFHVVERFRIKREGERARLEFLSARMGAP